MDKTKLLPVSAGILEAVFFGFSFMFTRGALEAATPLQLLGFRFALAAMVLTLLRKAGVIRVDLEGKRIGKLLLVALFQPVLYFLCETYGVKLTSASEAGMMIGLIPVVVVALEIPFFKLVPTTGQLFSVLLSVAGVFFIVIMKGNVELGYSMAGTMLLLGAVVAAGLYNILSKESSRDFTPVEITYIMMWAGALIFNILVLLEHARHGTLGQFFVPLADSRVLVAVLYLGVLSSVAAFFLVNYMLSRLPASLAATFANLTTVVSIAAGVVFRGEDFFWFHAVGAAMIILGVFGATIFSRETQGEAGAAGAAARE